MRRYCSIRSVIFFVVVFAFLLNVIRDFSKSNVISDISKITIDFFYNPKFTWDKFIFNDEVTLLEKRFAELRKILPAHSIVGYISNNNGDSFTETKYYYLAQYTLSPVIVSRDINHDIIIGYFNNPNTYRDISNFIILNNFENGVLLLTKKR